MIIKRVQTLVADMGQDWATPDYICEHLAIVNDDLEPELQMYNLDFDTQEVILASVPANTTNLSGYQGDGQPLGGMILPKTLEWRLAGQNDEQWQPVPYVQKVVDTNTGTSLPGNPTASNYSVVESWEWRNGTQYISPCSQIVDLRDRFQSLPVEINSDDGDAGSQPVRGVTNLLAFDVVLSIDTVRKAGNRDFIAMISSRRKKAFAIFVANQVKAKQGLVMRLGGRRSTLNGVPLTSGPPIVG